MTIGFKANNDGSGAIQINGVDQATVSTSGVLAVPAGISVPNTFGFKNRIINGDMRIDQRNAGASVAITGGATTLVFGPDRWQVRSAGANASAQQVTISGLRRLRFTGAASVTAVAAHQRIEAANSSDIAGSQVTVSVKASSTSLTSLTLELYYANSTDSFGTWGSPTVTSIGSTAVTISTTEQTVSATFTVPSAATTGLEVRVTGGALLASQTLTIGEIQLEKGSTATSFDYRPYGTELALCQRYYFKTYDQSVSPGSVSGNGVIAATSTANVVGGVITTAQFPVNMRAAPTVTYYSSATGSSGVWRASSGVDAGVATYLAAGERGVQIYNTVASGAASAGLYGHVVAAIEL